MFVGADPAQPVSRGLWQIGIPAFEHGRNRRTPEVAVSYVIELPGTDPGCFQQCGQPAFEARSLGLQRIPLTPCTLDDFKPQPLEQTVLADDAGQATVRVDHDHVAIAVLIHTPERFNDRSPDSDRLNRRAHGLGQLHPGRIKP